MTGLYTYIVIGSCLALIFAIAYVIISVIGHRRIIEAQNAKISEVKKSEQRYKALFENSIVGMMKFDFVLWTVLDANQTILSMLHKKSIYQMQEVLQEIPIDTKKEIETSLKHNGRFENKELFLSTHDGKYRSFLFSGRCDTTEKTVHAILIDVTEKKRLEEAYIRAHRMEAISLLTGSLAHDLQNILAPIQLSMKLLGKQIKTKKGRRIINATNSTTRNGVRLVNNILSLGRGVKGIYTPIHLNLFLKRTVESLENDKVLPIILHTNKIDYVIDGDESQLKQVFFNLVQNARDAMNNKGKVVITVQNDKFIDNTYTFGSVRDNQKYVAVSVTDTGVGISREQIDKIFEPFHTTKKETVGVGIGLSVVLEIIKKHDGFITVESKSGRGSTFNIFLPLKAQ